MQNWARNLCWEFPFSNIYYCFDLYSNVNDSTADLSVWGSIGAQHLTHSRCSVNVTERMNEGQALTRQKQPAGMPWWRSRASLPSPLIAAKSGTPRLEEQHPSVTLSFRLRKENPPIITRQALWQELLKKLYVCWSHRSDIHWCFWGPLFQISRGANDGLF